MLFVINLLFNVIKILSKYMLTALSAEIGYIMPWVYV